LRQSIEYDQNLPASLLALAKLNYQRDQYLTARAFLQRYEANASHTEESLELAYRVERELGDEKAAIEYRSLLMQNFPNSPASKALDK
jgi:type IV pilus assembly protein PilF